MIFFYDYHFFVFIFYFYYYFIYFFFCRPPDQRIRALKTTVNKLPPANYNNIRSVVFFF
jgi:hypothetical protein